MNTKRKGIRFLGILFISVIVILCQTPGAFSQHPILREDFSDTDLQTGTKWSGDFSNFAGFTDSTGNVWLRLNDQTESGKSILNTQSFVVYGSWSFTVNLDFQPSSSNSFMVQLAGDRPDLSNGGNGYALVVGENGDDDVWRLVRYDNGTISKAILSGKSNMSAGGISRVRITRNNQGKWTLAGRNDLNGALVVEASGADNAIQSSKYFGFKFLYTSTRSDKFYLDDISVDAQPAFLSQTNVISEHEIRVSYSLPVSRGSAYVDNLFLDNKVHPGSCRVDSQGKLVLQFNTVVDPGMHLMRLTNLKDLYGFDIPDTTIQVTWPYHAKRGDLVISEFMYDPPSGLPEYVELANTTEFDISVNGWTLGDSSNKHEINRLETVKPGGYLVLTPDSTSLFQTFGQASYQLQTNWSVLNNGGDAIVIRDATGTLIDSLSYNSNWGGRRVSLERKSYEVPGFYHWNWSESLNFDGGTPGKANTITSDITKPEVKSLAMTDDKHINIGWSEDIRDSSVVNPGHYHLDKGPGIANIRKLADSTFQITLNAGLRKNASYSLSVSGVVDWYGNVMTPVDTTITYYKIVNPDSEQVFITEFMFDPPESVPEYIELYNLGPDAIDLGNWRLSDSNNGEAIISDSQLIVPPDRYIILTSEVITEWNSTQKVAMHSRFPSLNNSGDQIKIYNSDGVLMDSLRYSSELGGRGIALERRSVHVPAWISSNWGDSPATEGGTPGKKNQIGVDIFAPEITDLASNNRGDRITLTTDEEVLISQKEHPQFQLNPARTIASYDLKGRGILLRMGENLEPGTRYTLKVLNLSDYFGNKLDTSITFTFHPDRTPPVLLIAAYNTKMDSVHMIFNEKITGLTAASIFVNGRTIEPPKKISTDSTQITFPVSWYPNKEADGDDQIVIKGFADRWGNAIESLKMPVSRPWRHERLLVNEIMYNPITDAHDNRPDQSEYIELYNNADVSLDLSGFSIHGEPDENGNFEVFRSGESNHASIAAHGYAVFYADTAVSFQDSRLYRFFKPDSVTAHFYRIKGMSLNLSSTGDAVYLTNDTTVVDSVEYSDAWQNPQLLDTGGRSLERITFEGPSNNKSNWTSCATDSGGTPGRKNSVFEQSLSAAQDQEKMLEILPNPFSPDGDGLQDNLLLSYHLTQSGYRLRVRIFDRYGRLIRTLADGKLAGSSGTLIWNGLDEHGRSNRIGIYIILFEAYGSKAGPDRETKRTAVLARHL